MFCRKCGQEIPDTAAFCSECGTRIISEEECAEQKAVLEDKPYLTVQEFIHSEYAVDAKKEYKRACFCCILACLWPAVLVVMIAIIWCSLADSSDQYITLAAFFIFSVVAACMSVVALKSQSRKTMTYAFISQIFTVFGVFPLLLMQFYLKRAKSEYLTYLHT